LIVAEHYYKQTQLRISKKKKKKKKKKNSGPSQGAEVNKVSVRRTSVVKPQGIDFGCNTTSPLKGVDTMLVTSGVTIEKGGGGRGGENSV
jgi:hypothetical protein